ncbi:hypothetical protein VT84_09170 [Gemmata sp. SH-PL17]|uniref:DUF1376 domain-containing protein n=1 Tax=Gemmata sp. SH-PL17 TaxID=1630693 RepID=UPI00078BF4B8|nr:DUF1376 domain-containing protein [Gemmata sp. SH-PL17]AMV24553.1 hypothetical protein VT84_09170 [Gemmata sp. SH-PL17]
MERPPYFAFYPTDFANDINVEAMSTLQVGAYMLLLCKAWQAEPPASLPNDDQVLARLARLDAVTWAEVKAGVLVPFRLGTDGRLHSKRLRREYDEALKRMKLAREHGRAGAEKRWTGGRTGATANANSHPIGVAIATPMPGHCPSNAIQSQREKEEEKTPLPPPERGSGAAAAPELPKPRRARADPTAAEADPRFQRFWAAYPRHEKRADAAKAFARIDPPAELLEAMLRAIEAQKLGSGPLAPRLVDGRSTVPHPTTWLNGRRWEDGAPVAPPVVDHAAKAAQILAQRQREEAARAAARADLAKRPTGLIQKLGDVFKPPE